MDKYLLLNAMKTRTRNWRQADNRHCNKSFRKQSKEHFKSMLHTYDYDSIVSLSRPRRGQNYKGSENFSGINKYLRSKVGQSWDETYSKICEVGDKRSRKLRRAVNLIKNKVLGWYGSINTKTDVGFHVDENGILQYLEMYNIPQDRKGKTYPSINKIRRFIHASKNYYDKTKWTSERKVIRQGTKLFWGIRTREDYYLQNRELKKGEYRFFHKLNETDQKFLIFNPVVTQGDKIKKNFYKHSIFGFCLSKWCTRHNMLFEHECGLSKKEWCDPRVKYVYPSWYNPLSRQWYYCHVNAKETVKCDR